MADSTGTRQKRSQVVTGMFSDSAERAYTSLSDKPEADDTARQAARGGEFEQTGRRAATRTVGVYERPAQRAGLSLPLLVIMILAALVSVVLTARFLF